MAGAVEGGEFVGQKAEQLRGLLKYVPTFIILRFFFLIYIIHNRLSYPIEHGIVKNFLDMEQLWNHAYHELSINPEDVHLPLFFFFYLNKTHLIIFRIAPRFVDRTTIEPNQKQRTSRANFF